MVASDLNIQCRWEGFHHKVIGRHRSRGGREFPGGILEVVGGGNWTQGRRQMQRDGGDGVSGGGEGGG